MKLKIALIAALSLWANSALAALRGTASGYAYNTTSVSVTVSGISIQSGDVVLLAINGQTGTATNPAFTPPTGFNAISGLTQQNMTVSSNNHGSLAIWCKDATGSEPTSYSVTSSVAGWFTAQVRVYSGRSTCSTITTVALTSVTALPVGTSPQNMTFTGLTPSSGSDVVLFGAVDAFNNSGSPGDTYAMTAPTGFANLVNSTTTTQYSTFLGGADLVNSPGTATGTLTSAFSWGATEPVDFAGFVLSVPKGSSSSPPASQGFFDLSP